MSRQIVLTRPWHNSSLPTLVVDGRVRRSDAHVLPNGVTAQGGRPPMTSSQSPETLLINGQLGTNEGSAFSTRHVHVRPYRGSRCREKLLPVIRSRSDVLPLITNSLQDPTESNQGPPSPPRTRISSERRCSWFFVVRGGLVAER